MAEFIIRSFAVSDSDAVARLWHDCGLVRPWNDPQLDIERKLAVGADLFLVAERAGVITGSVMGGYDGHRGWMNYLAVAPTEQGNGLGAALIEFLESKLISQGCPKLNLQVRTGNESVIGFYKSCGYSVDNVISLGKRLIADDA